MEQVEQELIPWLGRTSKKISLFMSEKFRENNLDLTKIQWLMLKKLCQKDGQMQKELAFLTDRDKASLARLVATMERKGFITRVPVENDKRARQIFLTEKGRAVFQESIPVVKEFIKELQKGIAQEELNLLINTLKKIQHNINQFQCNG
ncbi:MAG: MarR family transcriptional regulator [Bacteroidetes bacterium]|nr:MAG: MarR family transcriptional regulator [Bacteroidota bacterium]